MQLISPAALFPKDRQHSPYSLIDVRSPIEVARGSLPHAHTLPLMSDEERHQVGIRYKEAGQEAALALGFALTRDSLPQRIATWREVAQGPSAVMCWRGGLRSRLVDEFIGRPDVVRVEGGYKAVRGYLMRTLPERLEHKRTLVIGGLTGSGKTALLETLRPTLALLPLDLEALAKHRGSSFGRMLSPQPSQATFENYLAAALVLSPANTLVLEDESHNIGSCQLPDAVYQAICTSPLVLVEQSLEGRVRQIHQDYVLYFSDALGIDATQIMLTDNLLRLKARLGGGTLAGCVRALEDAAQPKRWRDPGAHARWIVPLLETYYDPLYRKSLRKTPREVIFRGTQEECCAWLRQLG